MWRWGLPLFNTRLLLEPAAARTSCSMIQNSKYYFATGQRGADGKRAVASATTSILRKAPKKKSTPHPDIVNRSVRTLAAHTGPSRPKDATRPRRHGKFFHFRHGREGLADRLTVGLVRGRWGNTPPGAHNSGIPVSIACSPDSGFAHTGHGSLHVDFKANTEA